MKNLKKLLCVTLTGSLLVVSNSLCTFANCANQSNVKLTTNGNIKTTNYNGGISPYTTYLKVDLTMDGSYNSYTQSWIQTQGFNYTRIYIKNTSDARIYFELDGGIKDSVEPHKEHMFYITNATAGRHYINLEGEYGANISGWVGVRESDSENF